MNKVINVALLKTAFESFLTALTGIFPKRKVITVQAIAGLTTIEYEDSWITADTDCYEHNMLNAGVSQSVTWAFTDGKVTFTFASAPSSTVSFNFGMIKGGV